MGVAKRSNPFPGLRPFEPDEEHLFFGREREVDDLLRRLRTNRFVAVVGTSGSGKSSLVRSGLIPSLHGGFMVRAGSAWRVTTFRPGGDPIGNLAGALNRPEVLGQGGEQDMMRMILDVTLRRSSRGLVSCVQEARLPPHQNVLVVIDQFEELFRFERRGTKTRSRDESVAFVKLLLEAARAGDGPIYVVLTMRSDFIGDCMQYPGLPEAINDGQYLVPRMTREELRLAITGPVAVGGGTIAPRLVVRLLNDVGDDPDQLPVLQHALMRTWDRWDGDHAEDEPIDVRHYEAVGTMGEALSLHADEAYDELDSDRGHAIAEALFKALTDTTSDARGIRRPTRLQTVAEIAGASNEEVKAVLAHFRAEGRSFLMPPAGVELSDESVLDISHESLMRVWKRLKQWAKDERDSAERYLQVAQAAARCEQGSAATWRDPELAIGLMWRAEQKPTAAWAEQYAPGFDRAMRFLDKSKEERDREIAEKEQARRNELRQARRLAAVLASAVVLVSTLAVVAFIQTKRASNAETEAQNSLLQGVAAVDAMLTEVGAKVLADIPQMEEVRDDLLDSARLFYERFATQRPRNPLLRLKMAVAWRQLGDIAQLREEKARANDAYRKSTRALTVLAAGAPTDPRYRQELAGSHNQLGWLLHKDSAAAALAAFDSAITLQEKLVGDAPENPSYRLELARSLNNRGILYANTERVSRAMEDFDSSIAVFEALIDSVDEGTSRVNDYRFRYAQSLNSQANLLVDTSAIPRYRRAVQLLETLPERREYQGDLAAYYSGLAFRYSRVLPDSAMLFADSSVQLREKLAVPLPSIDRDLANAHTLRAYILLTSTAPERNQLIQADSSLRKALQIADRIGKDSVQVLKTTCEKYVDVTGKIQGWQAVHSLVAESCTRVMGNG